MSNDIDSFDYDSAVNTITMALEELSLRQQRDAQMEEEIASMESKRYRLETRLEAINIKLQQLRRDATRQESATFRELKREAALMEQSILKTRDEVRALEHQSSQMDVKCGMLAKENEELRQTVEKLKKRVEDFKQQDSDAATKGFELRKLLQEVRFEVTQLEQEQCELVETERHASSRVVWLLTERSQLADEARRLEADNNALRLVSFAGALSRIPFDKNAKDCCHWSWKPPYALPRTVLCP